MAVTSGLSVPREYPEAAPALARPISTWALSWPLAIGLLIFLCLANGSGLPLLGDPDYGKGFLTKVGLLPEPARGLVAKFPRQALHAWLLGFQHPVTRETMHFESELPEDLSELLEALKAL